MPAFTTEKHRTIQRSRKYGSKLHQLDGSLFAADYRPEVKHQIAEIPLYMVIASMIQSFTVEQT